MIYMQGSSDDWNRLARETGDDGWSWDKIRPYMKKVRIEFAMTKRLGLILSCVEREAHHSCRGTQPVW